MPTPFMHLHTAEQIRTQVIASEGQVGCLGRRLLADWPAFYLGSVAPDYQTLCNVPRALTHFYNLPPAPENQAWPRMLAQYPQLAATQVPPRQALFIAAYCAHLMLDLVWFREILIPYFFRSPHIEDVAQGHLVHHVLLTYLDKAAAAALPLTAAKTLAAAEPTAWLPFATDAQLRAWRDMLVAQLQPGALLRTVEIYAGRLSMSPQAFAANLQDPTWMQANVFDIIPVDEVKARLATAVGESIHLIRTYLEIDCK